MIVEVKKKISHSRDICRKLRDTYIHPYIQNAMNLLLAAEETKQQ